MAEEKKKKTAAQFLVECLETEGVEYIFGIPGEENLLRPDTNRELHLWQICTDV